MARKPVPNVFRSGMDRETLYQIYKTDPQAALDLVLDEGERSLWKAAHLFTSCKTTEGTFAGSYQFVSRLKLKDRKYDIKFLDCHKWQQSISLYFTDVLYDMRTNKHLPKE